MGILKKPAESWDDTRMVQECLSGNEQAWSALIEKYKALIYSVPVNFRMPPHDAADIFQSTCMELLTRLPELREPGALPKWLIQVAYHQCLRWQQQGRRMVSRDAQPDLPEPEIPANAEKLVQQTQEEQMIREAMAGLTPQCRRLIELLFFESPARPYSEIAGELGLAIGSIGFTRRKCIDRLRRGLDALGLN